ncbi:28S ribosomal protein S11, mitochondrial isoform X3 [Heptranchias perlo]|uniref:28S ribosomal protein S11, mitochondrial isoform X3 n=1 Tax=Heptranchias perlo TaxID=212740 RepID=UPI003559A034
MLGPRNVLWSLGRGLLQAMGCRPHVSLVEAQCQRVHTSLQRLQELAEKESSSTELTQARHSADFSILPPMPGQVSPLRWGGIKYEDLHIVHIKATYNNTHVQVTTHEGQSMVRTSCGTEGFKNTKKGTPIAAQTAGISAAASAIKGLSMGGLQVVSITDNTPIPHNGCRPRKARRM